MKRPLGGHCCLDGMVCAASYESLCLYVVEIGVLAARLEQFRVSSLRDELALLHAPGVHQIQRSNLMYKILLTRSSPRA
jgi:hypothetical protein